MAKIAPQATRATPPLLKHLNERTVLETIRAGAPISRAEISRRAGISKPTVSLALQTLVDAGLVREAARGPSGPSYGAVFFEPVPEAAYVLGLDLGARFLRGAVCDLAGEVRARQDVELSGADADGALQAIAALRESLVVAAALPVERIDGIVLGVPGVIDAETSTLHLTSPNIPGLEGRAFGVELGERLGIDVTLENDVNLAAVGFSLSAPAWGWASCSAVSCTAAITARPAKWTGHSQVWPRTWIPRRTESRRWLRALRPPARPERHSRLLTTPEPSLLPRGVATPSDERWSRKWLDESRRTSHPSPP